MKSFVTIRTVSAGSIGVSVPPPGPSGARATETTTGVAPSQRKSIASRDTCGKRRVAIALLHTGLNPFRSASVS